MCLSLPLSAYYLFPPPPPLSLSLSLSLYPAWWPKAAPQLSRAPSPVAAAPAASPPPRFAALLRAGNDTAVRPKGAAPVHGAAPRGDPQCSPPGRQGTLPVQRPRSLAALPDIPRISGPELLHRPHQAAASGLPSGAMDGTGQHGRAVGWSWWRYANSTCQMDCWAAELLLGFHGAAARVPRSSACRQHVEDEQDCFITLQSAPAVIPAAARHSKEALWWAVVASSPGS